MSELSPCPFCAGELLQVVEASTYRFVCIECITCNALGPEVRRSGFRTPLSIKGQPEAVKFWNSRA